MGKYSGFTKVKLRKPERSKFDLSHEKKLSTRMGRLTPIFISETLPNDTFKVNSEVLLRLAPLLAPIYHRVNVFCHFFFIPNRLLAKDWEKFITNGRLGDANVELPYQNIGNALDEASNLCDIGSLWDYLGGRNIPDSDQAAWSTGSGSGVRQFSMLPFAAYYKVWYDYYRDRNYVDDNEYLPLASGQVTGAVAWNLMALRTRAWQHDYFTSALPFTQRGDEVLIPMEAAVTYLDQSLIRQDDGTDPTAGALRTTATGLMESSVVGEGVRVENIDTISNSTITINDLRQAVRLQEWFERNAVAGSRYNESIMAHFARKTSDGRLQRAEYLGGGRIPVQISEIATTAWSQDGASNDIPPATMTGRGSTYSTVNGFRYNCEEHGFVIGIMSVMPTSGYMQGIPRMLRAKKSFLDYPWPSFAHLGEQEVYKWELYATPTTYGEAPNDGELFGYQSRYADWKYMLNTAHGDFRTTLDYWHLDRKFSSAPTLGEEFVTFEDTLQDRIFAVSGVDTLWCYIHNSVSVVRSLPYFGTPML